MPEELDFEKVVGYYVQIRDAISEMKKKHDEELAPYKKLLDDLGNNMLEHLNKQGIESAKTSTGTVYKSEQYSTPVKDMEALWNWCITQGSFDMLDRKANKKAVKEYLEEHGTLPPGVDFNSKATVNVRRA